MKLEVILSNSVLETTSENLKRSQAKKSGVQYYQKEYDDIIYLVDNLKRLASEITAAQFFTTYFIEVDSIENYLNLYKSITKNNKLHVDVVVPTSWHITLRYDFDFTQVD